MIKKLAIVLCLCFVPSIALAADTLGAQPVKTTTKSSVQSQITDQAGTTLLNVQGDNTAPGAGGGAQVLIGDAESSAPTCTSGRFCMPWLDTSGRLTITTDAATNLRTNITQLLSAAPSATNPFPSQLTDGAASYVGAKTGQFPASLGQTTMAGSTSVTIASNQSTLPVSQGAPTGATSNRANAVSIASTATTAIVCKGSLAISQPFKLYQVHITSQSPARCTIQYNDNAAITKFGDTMISAATPMATFTCPAGFCALTTSATATTQQVEASCTNLDTITNDFVCDVQYCQSATGC